MSQTLPDKTDVSMYAPNLSSPWSDPDKSPAGWLLYAERCLQMILFMARNAEVYTDFPQYTEQI